MAAAGVIKDNMDLEESLGGEKGHWVLGYLGRLEDCTSFETELWRLFRGLELIQSRGIGVIEIESDSMGAIELIKEDQIDHSPLLVLSKEGKALLEAMRSSVTHIFREGNKVTDKLANIGATQDDILVSHIILPDEVIPLLEMDMKGVAFARV